jgi:3D (Asp-Asp-Asp) domain-containing protein
MQSNLGLFMLVPHIANVTPAVINAGATVTIDGSRLFTQGADCQAIIGHTVIQSDQYVAAAGNQIQIQVPAAQQAGQYAVRVRVAGAESFDAASVTVQ